MNVLQRHWLGCDPYGEERGMYIGACCQEKIDDVIIGCEMEEVELPEEMLNAVQDGDIEKIHDYLQRDFDVNAQCDGEGLLSRACAIGQYEIVELLLQYPNVHLNKRFEKCTPLMRAAQNGHTDCVRAILNVQGKCRPHLKYGWSSIIKVLKQKPQLSQESAIHILDWAGYKSQWEAVQLILQTDHHIPGNYMYLIIIQAVHQNKWYIVMEALARKFSGKEETLNEVIGLAVRLRLWDKVEVILQMKNSELKLEVPLVEAALNGMINEVQRLLNEKRCDAQILNGCLLVVAAGGTTEPVAQMLISIRDTYTHKTFSDALFLASLGNNSELISSLLCNSEALYTFHDLYRTRKILKGVSSFAQNDRPLLNCIDTVLKSKAKTIGILG